jgi:hypothetical protein
MESGSDTFRLSTWLYQLITTSTLSQVDPREMIQMVKSVQDGSSNLDTDGRIWSVAAPGLMVGGPLHALTLAGWSAADVAASGEFWRAGAVVAQRLGLRSTLPHILVNGRVGYA